MLALRALGVLDKTRAFGGKDITSEVVASIEIAGAFQASCYEDVVDLLSERGESELARTVSKMAADFRSPPLSKRLKRLARDIDGKYLNDSLRRARDYLRRGKGYSQGDAGVAVS
jgi:hypothetical protein